MASLPPKKDGSTTYKILPQSTEKDRLLPESSIADELSDIEEEKEESGSTLVIAFVLMLLFQLGNRIFGKLLTYPMHNYPMFTNMLSTVLYIPICFLYIFPMLFAGKISQEQRDIPKYKFSVMGAMDSLAGIMQVFAVNYMTNASMIVLVQQSAIPISMVISRLTLNARYNMSQYSGACVVLLGIIVVLLPNLLKPSDGTSKESATTDFIWSLVLVVSCIPMCLSSVYKEKALGEVDIDVIYLNGWVAVFQFLFSIPLCFPSAYVMHLPFNQILPNMYGGLLCWFGINTVTEATDTQQQDECSLGPLFVTVYLFFNVFYNILIIVILKHGSANILWMASTVIVPLSNVAFSLDFMPGHQPLRTWDIVGLVVIMGGLVVYRFTSQLVALWETVTGRLSTAEALIRKRARAIQIKMERLQTKFIGINQIESLQSLVDSRIMTAQRHQLFRSPQQIRGEFLHKLGIPPSPLLTLGPKGRYESLQYENGQNAMVRSSPRYAGRRQGQREHVTFAPSTKRSSEV